MKHYIIVKFIKTFSFDDSFKDIKNIFFGTLAIPGIHHIEYKRNIILKDNRADFMIIMTMDENSLKDYDQSSYHQLWKEKYQKYIEKKMIFDSLD